MAMDLHVFLPSEKKLNLKQFNVPTLNHEFSWSWFQNGSSYKVNRAWTRD